MSAENTKPDTELAPGMGEAIGPVVMRVMGTSKSKIEANQSRNDQIMLDLLNGMTGPAHIQLEATGHASQEFRSFDNVLAILNSGAYLLDQIVSPAEPTAMVQAMQADPALFKRGLNIAKGYWQPGGPVDGVRGYGFRPNKPDELGLVYSRMLDDYVAMLLVTTGLSTSTIGAARRGVLQIAKNGDNPELVLERLKLKAQKLAQEARYDDSTVRYPRD
jgi:hypothetical protein